MQDTSASHFFILPSELSKKLDEFLEGVKEGGYYNWNELPSPGGEGGGGGGGGGVCSRLGLSMP